jgi:Protein of unknown function (DUF2852)
MSLHATTATCTNGAVSRSPFPKRGWEIAGIILGFVFAWPLALTYLVWKLLGYPMPNQARAFLQRTFGPVLDDTFGASRSAGNSAFAEYRRRELARLEEERRRLDEESRAFAEFVDELKRARDREEFDAFMARRRANASRSTI